MEIFSFINIAGTFAFAASGALAGMRKKLDIFGVVVIAFVTAIGGGTIRDLLLGNYPVKWLENNQIVYIIILVALLTVIFKAKIKRLNIPLLFFDTLGLGLYTLKGVEVALDKGLGVVSCIIIGTITACFGGVIRDMMLNEIPTIFRKEIYATSCLVGSVLFFGLRYLNVPLGINELITFTVIITIRFAAIKYKFTLPNIGQK